MGLIFKNGISYAGVPEEIDAATVGGHTVEADVPADAAFTDNSDITAEGNPVILKELQGEVPFSKIIVKGENISGQEMTLTATGKNQLPITVTSGTGAGVTYTVDNDEITVSGTTTGVSTITISAPNMTITQDMKLSYRGNLSGMTPKATVLRNGETVYPTPNDTTGSKLLAGDVLQNVYIQQQNADVAVSGSAKFQLEYGTEVTEYEKYSSEICTFTPDSADYVIPTDIIQKEDVNVLTVNAEGATLSVTGVRTNAAVAKLWNKSGAGYDDTEIKEDIEELRNSIPSIEVDTTLSVEGAAADAKAVGDAIAELRALIESINIQYLNTEEDMVQIKDANGNWHDWASGGLQVLDLLTLSKDEWTTSDSTATTTVTVSPFTLTSTDKSDATSQLSYCKTVKAYDLTGKNKLEFTCSGWHVTFGAVQIINAETGDIAYEYTNSKVTNGVINEVLELPTLSGNYYIRLKSGVYNNANAQTVKVTIFRLTA